MMIKYFFIAITLFYCWHGCSQKENKPVASRTVVQDTTTISAINFDKDIKPIFVMHCSPCHFLGGKMYTKLPFDKPQTIHDHSEGILRRIKEEDDVKKLKYFLTQVSK